MWRRAAIALGGGLLATLLSGRVGAAPLGCPGGLLATHEASASTDAIAPTGARTIAFQGTQASGTLGAFAIEQCCVGACGAGGAWAGIGTTLITPDTPVILTVDAPRCLLRVTSTVFDGPVALHYRCGTVRR